MTSTDNYAVEGSSNLTTSRNNIMHTFFHSNISGFAGNLQVMLDGGMYKINMKNIHKLGWKAQLFKSVDVSILFHGCDVSQYPQFYEKIKIIISNVTISICGKLFR